MKALAPIYGLYGENDAERSDFWIHCESIASRSRIHNWEIRSHRHLRFFQLLYIRSGMGEALFGHNVHDIEPPSIVTIPPNHVHGFRFSKDIDGMVITLVAGRFPAFVESSSRARDWFGVPRVTKLCGHPDLEYVCNSLERVGEEFLRGFGSNSALVEAYLRSSLLLVARLGAPRQEHQAGFDRDVERLEVLKTLIAHHFREHKPVGFYASLIGISPTHLNRIASSNIQRTVSQMIADKIVDEAKRDLIFTGMSVRQIALRLGFDDPAYFSRFFLLQSGVPPGAYRKKQHNSLGVRRDT